MPSGFFLNSNIRALNNKKEIAKKYFLQSPFFCEAKAENFRVHDNSMGRAADFIRARR